MRINKVVIWAGIIGWAFLAGWLGYKALPFNNDEPVIQEQARADTASWGGFNRIAEHLNLMEEQRMRFHEREMTYRDSLFYYRQQLDVVEGLIVKELSVSEPDLDRLGGHAHEIGCLQESIKHLTIHHFLALREICTPEQQEKLMSMFSQMHQVYGQGQRGEFRGQGMRRGRRNRQSN